ncbi:hypothetical protein ACFX2A_002956 [Malus domestica]
MEVGLGFLGTFNTKYYYVVGIGHTERKFWFITPEVGPDATYTFGLIGDLGQTYDSNKTLTHYRVKPAERTSCTVCWGPLLCRSVPKS